MDPSRFDTLVRTLTTGGSRRRILGVLSALPLVGTALAAVPDDTAAKAKGNGRGRGKRKHQDPERDSQRAAPEATSCARRCRKKASKQARRTCRKRCTPPTPECTTSADCPSGELCESGVCIPIPDQCGADSDCDACERCQGGVCMAQCTADQVCRGTQCETVQCTVDADCGDCSRCIEGHCRWQCAVTEVCLSGAGGRCCQPRGCPAGKDCGTADDGCGGQARCGADTCTQPSNPCQAVRCTGNQCVYDDEADGIPCGTGQECQHGQCVCASDCTGKCNGASDGCGGLCPRCANGQPCGSRDDCASAYCVGGICQPCAGSNNCYFPGLGPNDPNRGDDNSDCNCAGGVCYGQDAPLCRGQ